MSTRPPHTDAHLIGVISDTHGLLRPEVVEALRAIAAVAAVRGNNDKGEWARAFPETQVVEVGSVALYVLHDVNALDLDPVAAGFRAVISGHSHRPAIATRQGVVFVNPGSAGPRRVTV